MDKILSGALAAERLPATVRRQILAKIEAEGSRPHTGDEVVRLLDVAHYAALYGKTAAERDSALAVFCSWSKNNIDILQSYMTSQRLPAMMMHGVSDGGRSRSVAASGQTFTLLRSVARDLAGTPAGHTVLRAVCCMVSSYVCERSGDVIDLASVASFFHEFGLAPLLLAGSQAAAFCEAAIRSVAAVRPSEENLQAQVTAVIRVSGFLRCLWFPGDKSALVPSLEVLFGIISQKGDSDEPYVMLGAILQAMPADSAQELCSALLRSAITSDDKLCAAMCRMIGWLVWVKHGAVREWILTFHSALCEAGKIAVVQEVAELCCDEVADKLLSPVTRDNAVIVLETLLMTCRFNPDAFHKALPKLIHVVRKLLAHDTGNTSSDIACGTIAALARLIDVQMAMHPGYPDLYEDALVLLRQDVRHGLLSPDAVAAQLERFALPRSSKDATGCVQQRRAQSCAVRRPGDKTGLANLGNTCYVNSVLQMLFMCEDFCHDVLCSDAASLLPQRDHTLLSDLQQVFAYLAFSQRSVYSPAPFIQASLPSWFEAGAQQDCTEYLHHVFSRLHEEEVAAAAARLASQQAPATDGSERVTLMQRHFGGWQVITYRCLTCGATSCRREYFTDLPLHVPAQAASPPFAVSELLERALSAERLDSDEQYCCGACQARCDGERSVAIAEAPPLLLVTLCRFAYDREKKTLAKIVMPVHCSRVLSVPLCSGANGSSSIADYALCAAIVHSGATLGNGHYYCYARHAGQRTTSLTGKLDPEHSAEQWFLFNDAHVSSSSYDAIPGGRLARSNVRDSDAVYVLLYQRTASGPATPPVQLACEPASALVSCVAASSQRSEQVSTLEPAACRVGGSLARNALAPVPGRLMEAIRLDNEKLLAEQQALAQSRQADKARAAAAAATTSALFSKRSWHDDDDQPPDGEGNGPLDITGSRFIF